MAAATGAATGTARAIEAAGPGDLRAFLAERLPSYLVPDQVVTVPSLPRNANGKVDKAALPLPSAAPATPEAVAITDTEHRIAALWRDLLGAETVAPDDDFFGLGGYSLLVAKMLAQVDEAFGRTVPLAVFLTDPTLGSLARAVDETTPTASEAEEAEDGIDIESLSDAEAAALLAILTAEDSA
jgi:hypothetical protein